MNLTSAELQRYDRHIRLSEVGTEGQLKLKNARVLIIGAGGLGSPAALYLAAAGIGKLGIVDDDVVSISNLQRQILYSTPEVDAPKALTAKNRLSSLNPEILVQDYNIRLTEANVDSLFEGYDIIIDGTDQFESRYLINDACVRLGKLNISGAVQGFDAQVSVFCHPEGPCYRCVYPEPPPASLTPDCSTLGVLGVLPGMTGTIQAAEALKILLKIGEPLIGKLLVIDSLTMACQTLKIQRSADCFICGNPNSGQIKPALRKYKSMHTSHDDPFGIAPAEAASRLESRKAEIQLVDVRTLEEFNSTHVPGAIHIPVHELSQRLTELNPHQETLLYCHAGVRSLNAAHILAQAGFTQISHVLGGIAALSRFVKL